MSNPWKDCKLLFNENDGHFIERMKDRSYSGPDFREFLINGTKQPNSKKDECEQDFVVEYSGWIVKCKVRCCNIVMGTLYRSR
jgi:hypothetical protein